MDLYSKSNEVLKGGKSNWATEFKKTKETFLCFFKKLILDFLPYACVEDDYINTKTNKLITVLKINSFDLTASAVGVDEKDVERKK